MIWQYIISIRGKSIRSCVDFFISGYYDCYHWTPADNAEIGSKGSTTEAKKEVCESKGGNVYTDGDGSLAPGCGSCGCCKLGMAPGNLY